MKKHLLLLVSILISTLGFSQIGIVDMDGNNVEGTVVDVYLTSDIEHVETDFKTENLSDVSKSYNLKRYEIDYIVGSQEYYCWMLCLQPTDAGTNYLSIFPGGGAGYLELDAGAEGVYGIPAFHFRPEGNIGEATYRYIVYDVNDENDSAYVDIHYVVGTVGVDEYDNNSLSNVYPNPAQDMIYIDVNTTIENAEFEVYSLVGTTIGGLQIDNRNSRVSIDVSSLSPGIYLLQEKRSQLTRRFIISR